MTEELLKVLPEVLLGLCSVIFGLKWFKSKSEKEREKLELDNLKLENQKLKSENLEVNQKLQFLDRVLDLEFINQISLAVDRIFEETKADRFLIFIAKNGVTDFNIVNVVFEQHKNKEFRINAIARYRNVHIDDEYKNMLKEAEFRGYLELETAKMKPSLLRDFYALEGVTHSKVRHLARKPIDEGNDFLVFSSLATHDIEKFNDLELALIKTQYEGTIMPALEKVID